jgi:hypothetical protein
VVSTVPFSLLTGILYAVLVSLVFATCSSHLILLELVTLLILSKGCKLWSLSLCNYLKLLTFSSVLSSSILLDTLFSNTLNLWPPLEMRLTYLRVSANHFSSFVELLVICSRVPAALYSVSRDFPQSKHLPSCLVSMRWSYSCPYQKFHSDVVALAGWEMAEDNNWLRRTLRICPERNGSRWEKWEDHPLRSRYVELHIAASVCPLTLTVKLSREL